MQVIVLDINTGLKKNPLILKEVNFTTYKNFLIKANRSFPHLCLSSNRNTQEGVQGKGESGKHQDKETDVNICRTRLFLLTTMRTKFQDHDSIGHIILKLKNKLQK